MSDTVARAIRADPEPQAEPARRPAGFSEAAAGFVHRSVVSSDAPLTSSEAVPGLGSVPRLTPAQIEALLARPPRESGLTPDRVRLIGVRPHRIGGADLIRPRVELLPRGLRDRMAKRAVDVVGTVAALVLAAPVMIAIAAVLWLEGRQVLFCQTRIGRARTRFRCFKFRSMRPDSDRRLQDVLRRDPAARAEWMRHQKLTDDPRITRFGRFLRKSSLDELPQLFNVLRGEMSLVGPRPIIAPEIAGYDADRIYYESSAFNDYAGCLPGITGVWQVSGRHRTAHQERVRLDQWYARNWSFWLDLKILLKTVRVVWSRSGV